MIVFVATPLAAVAVPVPVTVPAPDCLPKVMTVVLSAVTVLPAASWIVAVRTRVAPEVRLVVAPVSAIWAAAPWTTVKAPRVPVVSPAAVASIVTDPTSCPVIVFVATPLAAVAVPVPVTVPGPDCLPNVTTVELSDVTVLPAASWIVAVRTRVAPGHEVRGGAGERDLGGCAVDDGEGAEGAGGEPGRGRFHRDRADEGAGDRLRGDAAGGGCGAGAGDGAGARLLSERDDGGAVAGDRVPRGIPQRGREDAGRAGGQVGRRSRQ